MTGVAVPGRARRVASTWTLPATPWATAIAIAACSAAMVLATAASPSGARAASADVVDVSAYRGWDVTGVRVTGVENELADQILAGIELSGRRAFLRTIRPPLLPSTLETDLDRIHLFLARRGYPDARVAVMADPEPDHRRVALTLGIDLGLPVRIRNVNVSRISERLDERTRDEVIPLRGAIYSEPRIETVTRTLLSLLREDGHAAASIVHRTETGGEGQVDLHFIIDAGPRYRFGHVQVDGVSGDLETLVRKVTAVPTGDFYSPRPIREAEVRLQALGLFRRVRLVALPAEADTLNVQADLRELPHQSWTASAGYWTDEKIRGSISWEHRNAFRRGQGISIGLSASQYEQDATAAVWKPALLGPTTRGRLALSARRQNEDSYELVEFGGNASVTRQIIPYSMITATLSISRIDFTARSPDAESPKGSLSSLAGDWTRDSSDDRLDPTRGAASRLSVEWTPPVLPSEAGFVRGDGAYTRYQPLGGAVLASRVRLGLGRPVGSSSELLSNRRFFAGGATSMRGFGRRRLGPKDAEGRPVGGEAGLEASTELRLHIRGRVGGALFVDAGQVWRHRDEIRLGDLEFAVGPALTVRTPVGPVRADVGIRITSRDRSEPDSVFHVTIGNPY